MNDLPRPPASPLLDHCPDSLPASWYHDPEHHARELALIWRRHWLYAGRAADLPEGTVRRFDIAGQNLILVKDQEGAIRAFHNTCRHRGAELCAVAETRLRSKLITCRYHEWAYDLTGRLVRVPYATPTADFRTEDHGLLAVPVHEWNGFVFVCLDRDPPPFAEAPDLGIGALDNWPMASLVTGHRLVREIACNWKIFWENYNECLHCPGTHPDLCDLVPVYRRGIMSESEDHWQPRAAELRRAVARRRRSWTVNGAPCGPEFPGLTEAQRQAGHHFVTLWPTMYVVAHVDYVRTVSLRPIGPERTALHVEWLFPRDTLDQPDFDLENVVGFAAKVIEEDGAASEMNQRGLKSAAFTAGRLMPQEFDVHRFQQWVRRHLG